MCLKIFFNTNLETRDLEKIRSGFPDVELILPREVEQEAGMPPGAEVLVTWWNNFTASLLQAPGLKWVHTLSAGVDGFLLPPIIQGQVVLTNSSGIHGIPIAEHTFAMMLSFSRGIRHFVLHQQQRQWNHDIQLTELHGKTLGVVGLGNIGREIARLGTAFGMRVLGVRRTPGQPEESVHRVVSFEGMDMVLKESDYVVLAVPLTVETKGMIGMRELELMKGAFLVNIARGEVVDETALIRALEQKVIAGAGLDVFCQEPLPADSPFYRLDNCLISPHRAAISPQYMDRAIDLFCRNLEAYIKGEPLPNRVDPAKGY